MTDTQLFLLLGAMFALMLPGSIVFLATRLSKTLSITVQAPTALLPERVQQTLDAINEKLTPAKLPASDDYLRELVSEAVTLGESADKKLRGPDRFRIARAHIAQRLELMKVEADMGDVARRIEVEVKTRKSRKG